MKNLNIPTIENRFYLGKISIASANRIDLVPYDSILFLESDSNYTIFYLENNEKIVSSRNIGYYEEDLKNTAFFRVHNSYIVNLAKVASYIRGDESFVILSNKKPIKVARSKREELLAILAPSRP